MRAAPLLAVAGLHGALLMALSPGSPPANAASARQALPVRLLPVAAPSARPAPPRAALPPLSLPAVAAIAPLGFELQADARPALADTSAPAVAPVPAPVDAPAATHAELPASEPPLQSARRAACAPAPHPPALQERGIESVVRLRVWVDEGGRAGQVVLAASSGWRLFDDAAVAQARRCPFQPALRGSQPVGSWVEFPVRFALENAHG